MPFEITPATREALDAWGACRPRAVFSGKAVAAPADTITGRLGQLLAARASRLAAARLGSNFSQHQNQPMRVDPDDPARPDVFALLEEHLRNMHELSPPESVHALDVTGLQSPEVTFWSVRDQDRLLGCGALKELDTEHGEVKSMRTPQSLRRNGAGRAVLKHIIEEARRRGYQRLSLETGSMEAFRPAWRLYESFGFQYCGPFADYKPDPNSVFMTLVL